MKMSPFKIHETDAGEIEESFLMKWEMHYFGMKCAKGTKGGTGPHQDHNKDKKKVSDKGMFKAIKIKPGGEELKDGKKLVGKDQDNGKKRRENRWSEEEEINQSALVQEEWREERNKTEPHHNHSKGDRGVSRSRSGFEDVKIGPGAEEFKVEREDEKRSKRLRKTRWSTGDDLQHGGGSAQTHGSDVVGGRKPGSQLIQEALVQGEYKEYVDYPGWSVDEIHWMVEQILLHRHDLNWNMVASLLEKRSPEECENLWKRIIQDLKPMKCKTALDYVKKCLLDIVVKSTKEGMVHIEDIPKQPPIITDVFAEKENLTQMSNSEIHAKLQATNNAKRAEYLESLRQRYFKYVGARFDFYKHHRKVFKKVSKRKVQISRKRGSHAICSVNKDICES